MLCRGEEMQQDFRKCGQCTECCTQLEIPSLEKAAKDACNHLKRTGCSIYQTRPAECRGFQCVWTEKMLPNSARPDQSGLLAYRHHSKWGPALTLVELRAGAIQRQAKHINTLQRLVDREGWAMIIIDHMGRSAAMIPEN